MLDKRLDELSVDRKFERLTPVSKEELTALEQMIVADGEIHSPIIVWQGQNIVVDGHSRLKILSKHPKLKYTIKEISFGYWQDAMVWIVEHHIARKSFTLWQRLEMALSCEEYWKAKEEAKRNQGARSDLKSPGDKKLKPIDVDRILAEKVGCGKTTVSNFKKVFREASEGTKQRCREGDMSIKRAFNKLTEEKKPPKKKPKTVVENEKIDILDECEKNQTVSDNSDINIPDPAPIVKQITEPKVADEVMWIAINPVEQLMQIFKKKHDADKGINHIYVNSFSFTTIPQEGAVSILEVKHIGVATEEFEQKDEKGFESEQKKAS